MLKSHGYNVRGSDILDRGYPNTEIADFLFTFEKWHGDIITNPPYKQAVEFVRRALNSVEDGAKVAMFLKLTFLESKSRRKLFEEYPLKTLYVSSGRLYCAKNGEFDKYSTCAIAYGWYVWEKGFVGDPIIKWIN